MPPQMIATGVLGTAMVVLIVMMGRNALKMCSFASDPCLHPTVFRFPKWDLFKRSEGIEGEMTYHLSASKLMYKTVWLYRLGMLIGVAFLGCGTWTIASIGG